jgi:hypothetical protein
MQNPPFPDEAENVWLAMGQMPFVTSQEIESYSKITGIEFTTWEVKALFALERLRHDNRSS